tara:strand:+ start:447229 stop:448203 length:975 start_codon:yes stop_codon:yes gene_type:complete
MIPLELEELKTAAAKVYQHMLPSAQLQWPLLDDRCGCRVLVKHENHNPTGAFKVRGGLVYAQQLSDEQPGITGLITATRGNHGQSIAFAAGRHGLNTVIVVPQGNSPDKNAAMVALGAELIEYGKDFDEASAYAQQLAQDRGLLRIPSFDRALVAGVASYGLELLQARPNLKRVYVPIGLGSGACGLISARNALGLSTEIIGVVASGADCYLRSFESGQCVATASADTAADGLAVRVPNPDALAMMLTHLERVVAVDDDEIFAAVGHYFTDTHNIAEGAGGAALAALLKETEINRGLDVGVILSGGNISRSLYARALGCTADFG